MFPLDNEYLENKLTTQPTQDTTQIGEFVKENIESAMLDLIALDSTLSQSQIAKRLDLNLNTVKYYIRKLRKTGQIDRIGSSQKGKWVVVDKQDHH